MHTRNSDKSLREFLHGFRLQEVFRHGGEQGVSYQFSERLAWAGRGRGDCGPNLPEHRKAWLQQQREARRL